MVGGLIALVVYIIIVGIILWLLRYLIGVLPMDEQFRTVANVIILVVGVLILILLLLNFAGLIDGGMPRLR